jgi:hypothetical protein
VCWNTTERLEITKSCEMMAWRDKASHQASHRKWGPPEFQNLTCSSSTHYTCMYILCSICVSDTYSR